jgi:uncharacterized membrane protein
MGGLFEILWVLVATIGLSITLERSRYQRFIPGPILVLIIPCLLANIGVLPSTSPVYDSISAIAIPFGVILLLLRANLGEILRSSGKMLPVYLLAAVGVVISILIVGQIMHFEGEAGLWSLLSALFIGSVVNVMATAQAIRADETLVAAVIAANAVMAPAYLAVVMVLMRSELVGRLVGSPPGSSLGEFAPASVAQTTEQGAGPKAPMGELVAILYALGAFVAVERLAAFAGIPHYSILLVTIVAVAVPNLFPGIRRLMSGAREIGMISMLMFIGVLSAQIDLGALGYFSLRIMGFVALVLGLNLIFLMVIGRLFRADPHVLFLASQAGVGGPTSTAAVAASQGREDLVTPGILCALLGVIISTFIGVLGYQILSG